MTACRLCCRIRHPHAPGTCIAPPGRRCEIRRVPVYPGGNASASVLEGQGSPRNINSMSLTGGRLSLVVDEWPSVVRPRVGWCTKARGATAVQGTGALMRGGIGVHWLVGIGGYWWVLGVLAPPAALTTTKVRPKTDTNRPAVCVGLCRRLLAWGVLRRERQMYYNIKKGADAVGATSGHCVRACASEFYQDQVSRPVWCERGGSAGVYGATAGTMLR